MTERRQPSICCRRSTCAAAAWSGSQQGAFDRRAVYGDDPAAVATGFAEAGARWIHVVDLDGARTGTRSHDRARSIVQPRGGARTARRRASRSPEASGTTATVERILAAGAARVVLGTAALRDPAAGRDPGRRSRAAPRSPSPSTSATAGAWATAGCRCRGPAVGRRDRAPRGGRRRDLRRHRDRPRRAARRTGPRPARASAGLDVAADVIASGGIATIADLVAVRAWAAPARSSGGPCTRAARAPRGAGSRRDRLARVGERPRTRRPRPALSGGRRPPRCPCDGSR